MPSGITTRSLFLSIVLHAIIVALLIFNIALLPRKELKTSVPVNIVQAVTVDSKAVDAEVQRLKEADRKKEEEQQKKEQELKDRLDAIQKKTAVAEKQRREEQQRIADLKAQKEKEQKDLEAQQKKADELKKQQDELEKKRKAEEDRKKAEEAKKKKEEEDRKKKAAQEALQKEMEAEQAAHNQKIANEYGAQIKAAISRQFNLTGLPDGLQCVLHIRMTPTGDVIEAHVTKSSGNDLFDRRAELAVSKASPLPVPSDPAEFEIMRDINLTFAP